MFSQQIYPQQLSGKTSTIAEAGSLLVAFSNGIEAMTSQTVDPPTLNQFFADIEEADPDLYSISLFDPTIAVSEIEANDNLPPSTPAIVKFQTKSVLTGEQVDFYCWVSHVEGDFLYIVDSWDGLVKAPGVYEETLGKPVAWATYKRIAPKVGRDRTHVLGHKETLWDAARKLRIPAQDLIDHNDIEKPHLIGEGDTLHIPTLPEVKAEPQTLFQWFDKPQTYHINVEGGATKWAFGNAKEWKQIIQTGPRYKKGTIVSIVGIAQVPLEDSKEPAGYYLDRVSAGDNYHTTKRPVYPTGYSWHDLKAGEPPKIYPPSEKPVQEPPKPKEESINPNQFKSSFRHFKDDQGENIDVKFKVNPRKVVTPVIKIYDYVRLKSVDWQIDRTVLLAGTFTRDGRLYGRPAESVKSNTWYGFPMRIVDEVIENVIIDDDIYELTQDVSKPRFSFKNGRLTLEEYRVTVPLSKATKPAKNMLDLAYKMKQKIKEKR